MEFNELENVQNEVATKKTTYSFAKANWLNKWALD